MFDENGLALRGLLVRQLVMPGLVAETREILTWIARELGSDTSVNLMDQYWPSGKVSESEYTEINRRITSEEYQVTRSCRRAPPLGSSGPTEAPRGLSHDQEKENLRALLSWGRAKAKHSENTSTAWRHR